MSAQLQKILDTFSDDLKAYIAETVKAEVEKQLKHSESKTHTEHPKASHEVAQPKKHAPDSRLELAHHVLDKVRARKK